MSTKTAEQLKEEGNISYTAKDYQKAVELYTEAISLAKDNAVLYSNRSAAYLGLNNFKLALEDADRCLELDQSFAKGYGRRGAALLGLCRPGHAEKAYKEGLALEPGNAYLKQGLQDLLKDDGDQSPVSRRDGGQQQLEALQQHVALGLDIGREAPSKAWLAAVAGQHEMLLELLQPQDLVERATALQLPILAWVVVGATRVCVQTEQPPNFPAVLRHLIEQGARVDAKDAAGWTALMHCVCSMDAFPHDLAEVLLEAGADPNVQDKFGVCPMMGATSYAHKDACQLLQKYGGRE